MGHIIRLVVVGLIVGILARFFYPGAVHLGWIGSIVLGIAGSFVAGFVAKAIHPNAGEPMHPAGFIASIIGAMVLIFLARLLGLSF
ncbi:GlsB/YeaQ/YmgE family stress response membrane protein [Hephaestia mangrovi]|uniref:GlsB/YeaQ/YmgE family stress response membrane protein n=1 Tax=Hephaestia mangrovi TaxID=2873268 RepID=UPI001CA6C7E6|nr:GlsB/YeaQ/YmgE family stress response membrane protein [Hephaestia mangrovi]MBY8826729.1 GlsB/YeaQ/YmgE family stress response membrane protein [Hephaestia mangrovi]